MIRCLITYFDMLRSSLADRPKPLAAIGQNDGSNCSISAQSAKCMRLRWRKMTAKSPSNTVDRPPAAMSVSPACALSL
jgi:hypothetical protein